jgi:hypothetical protein
VGFNSPLVLPSPKSHRYPEILPLLRLVNFTERGAEPVVGLPIKSTVLLDGIFVVVEDGTVDGIVEFGIVVVIVGIEVVDGTVVVGDVVEVAGCIVVVAEDEDVVGNVKVEDEEVVGILDVVVVG